MDIKINKIVPESYVDGPGKRTVVFLQGCTLACPGCQNKALWDRAQGVTWDTDTLARHLAEIAAQNGGNVTISGGEPFQQPRALAALVRALKAYGVVNIISYSGYTWEELLEGPTADVALTHLAALQYIDVLVDGRFIRELDDPFITYRGSRNQRPVDVQASLGRLWAYPVVLDWNNPELVIRDDGSVLLPVGMVQDFDSLGNVQSARMCGQTKEVKGK